MLLVDQYFPLILNGHFHGGQEERFQMADECSVRREKQPEERINRIPPTTLPKTPPL
ncbi:MAG: hypothetical protein MPW15_18720 [Candidatus Manganitrophus sp.]|nr:hypothetical protein [Candidatus Manganitrophus sp.]